MNAVNNTETPMTVDGLVDDKLGFRLCCGKWHKLNRDFK